MIRQTETFWNERNDPVGLRLSRFFGYMAASLTGRPVLSTETFDESGKPQRLKAGMSLATVAIEAYPKLNGGYRAVAINHAHIDGPGDYRDVHAYGRLGFFSNQEAHSLVTKFKEHGQPTPVESRAWTETADIGKRRGTLLRALEADFA